MSEFDKELTPDVPEKSESVEAFEDFEISAETSGAESDSDEGYETSEQAVAEVAEAIEEAEIAAEEAAAAADSAEDAEEPTEAADSKEETEEPAEAADSKEETEEPAEAADSKDDGEEPVEAADSKDDGEEPVEATDDAEDAKEPVQTAGSMEDAEEIEAAGNSDEAVEDDAEISEEVENTSRALEECEEEQTDGTDTLGALEFDDYTEEELSAGETAADGNEESEDDGEFDIMSSVSRLDDEDVSEDAAAVAEEASGLTEEAVLLAGAAAAEALEEPDKSSEQDEKADTVDEDDYLDYDDEPKPKRTVSGKAAAITMIVTGVVTICLIAGAFWAGVTLKRDIGVSLVSYTDRFNACETENFTLGQMIGVELISMSDTEYTFSAQDISNLKKGAAVTKFNNLVNIKTDTRFGRIVSMDITFDPALDKLDNPSASYMLLLGNAISGLFSDVNTSDAAFITAYNVLVQNARLALVKGSNVYAFKTDDFSVYADYTKMAETHNRSDVSIHIESTNPDYIDARKLDFSWIPFDFSSKKTVTVTSSDPQTASSEVSPTDK